MNQQATSDSPAPSSTATPKANNRRRQLIVDKKAQGNLILHVSFVPAVALSLATALISMFCYRLQEEAQIARVDLPSLTPLLLTLFGFVAVASLFIMLNAVRISNRVAGPAHNICRALRRIREGDLEFQVVLRDGDQLEGLEQEVNQTIQWLREHRPTGIESAPEAAASAPAATAVPAQGEANTVATD